MKIDNRLTVFIALLCLSILMIISCAQKGMNAREESKPSADSPVSQQMSEASKAPESQVTEEALASEKKTEIASLTGLKEEKTDPNIQSEIRTFEATPIYFDFDKSVLTSDARVTLKTLAEWLHANPEYTVLIEGHSDERGSAGYNLALSETRAIAAEKYLQTLGVEADRISTLSWGEEVPADPGRNEDAWARNRRDEFKLIRKP